MARLICSFFLFFCLFAQKGTVLLAADIPTGAAIDAPAPQADYPAYVGLIPEQYRTYLLGYADSRGAMEHYVMYITQESRFVSGATRTVTVYNVAIGTDLTYDGNSFSGSVTIYKIYSNTNYFNQFVTVIDTNFNLYPGTDIVATDVDSPYPDISDTFSRNLFILFVFVILFFCVGGIFYAARNSV